MAMVYLLLRRAKNRLIALLKSPGGMIGLLLMVGLFAMLVVTGNTVDSAHSSFRDIHELYALVLVLYAFIFFLTAKNGLGKGVSLFSMADANILFTAPISSRRILFYGLAQQLGNSLMMGMFLLYQYGWMRNLYGVTASFAVALAIGYALTVFCAQLTAMTIYVWTAGRDDRKRIAQGGLVLLAGIPIVYIAARVLLQGGDMLAAAVGAATGMPLSLMPVFGWMRALVTGIYGHQWLIALLAVAASAGFCLLLTWLITRSQADYYEDVLQATERSYAAVVSAREGKTAETLPSNIKTGKIGIGKGWGASAFYYKQRLENRRARRFALDFMSLIMLLAVAAFAFFMREEGVIPVLVFATYMQFFTVSSGRWVRELLQPYIYRVPEPSFKKLLYCLVEEMRRLAVEAVLMGVVVGLILSLSPLEMLALCLARFSFGLLLTSGMLLVERLFPTLTVRWLALIVLVIFELVMVTPGIALAIYAGIALPNFLTPTLTALLMPTVLNIPVALLAIFGSRRMLEVAELNQQ